MMPVIWSLFFIYLFGVMVSLGSIVGCVKLGLFEEDSLADLPPDVVVYALVILTVMSWWGAVLTWRALLSGRK